MSKTWIEMTDRERDTLIAEKVIGAEREEANYTIGYSSYTSVFWHIRGWRFDEAALPHYSTEIGAAWRVVEELQRRGITVEIYNGSRGGCTVKILDFEKGRKWESTSVDGAPEAICLVALKACGVGP